MQSIFQKIKKIILKYIYCACFQKFIYFEGQMYTYQLSAFGMHRKNQNLNFLKNRLHVKYIFNAVFCSEISIRHPVFATKSLKNYHSFWTGF